MTLGQCVEVLGLPIATRPELDRHGMSFLRTFRCGCVLEEREARWRFRDRCREYAAHLPMFTAAGVDVKTID